MSTNRKKPDEFSRGGVAAASRPLFAAIVLMTAAYAVVVLSGCVSKEVLEVRAMQIGSVDLDLVADGTHRGDFTYGEFTYIVDVVVLEHRITEIVVVANRDSTHAQMAEGVLDTIVSDQRTDVDVVAGATTTSKALLKAVENALTP